MVLYGASGHCKVVIDILESLGVSIDYIVDDNPEVSELLGYEVRRNAGEYDDLIVAIGSPKARKIEKVGVHIVRVHYSPDVAVCSPIEEDGHFEALLAENTDWEKLVDQTFKPYRINIKYDEA